MKQKKIASTLIAMALTGVLSVAGTLAYLTAQTDPVTNTFAAAGLVDDGNFLLKEHEAVADGTNAGKYTLNNDSEVEANDYKKVVPGIDLPKDPFVRITDLQANAYLFVEIKDTTSDKLTWDVTNDWTKLEGVTGQNGGTVYAYNDVLAPTTATATYSILADDKVVVANDYAPESSATTEEQLVFTAYLAQSAGFNNATDAYKAAFQNA